VPARQIVGQFLATFKEYPPNQKVGSFSLDQVLEKLQQSGSSGQVIRRVAAFRVREENLNGWKASAAKESTTVQREQNNANSIESSSPRAGLNECRGMVVVWEPAPGAGDHAAILTGGSAHR
jgi:hypothetical protein